MKQYPPFSYSSSRRSHGRKTNVSYTLFRYIKYVGQWGGGVVMVVVGLGLSISVGLTTTVWTERLINKLRGQDNYGSQAS